MKVSFFNRSIFFVLFCASIASVSSQNMYVKGTIKKGEEKRVHFFQYNDRISLFEQPISEYVVKNEKDTFTFSLSINYPTLVVLQIEMYSQEFFVEPNHSYEILIPDFDWDIDEKVNVNLNPVPLPIVFINAEKNDLNMLIYRFDELYSSFIKKHQFEILVKKNKKLIDTLQLELQTHFDSIEDSYFLLYKKYKLAALELSMGAMSKLKMGIQYLQDQPIYYNHIAYMDFFNLFFEGYFFEGTKQVTPYQIGNWINENKLFELLDSLGTEPLLRNEQFRELVFLKGMNEAYYKNLYDHRAITNILITFIEKTKFEEHQKIAQGIIDKYQKNSFVENGKQFQLLDINKQLINLDSFKGQWVYLNFVRLKEAPSLRELASLAHYHDSICKLYNITFVTICCDREFQRMFHFLKNSKNGNKYNWTWLHFNNNYDFLDFYRIKVYPYFVLINPEGNIVSSPAKSPQQGFFINPNFINKRINESNMEINRD